METTSIKQSEITQDWFIVDAEGQTLGRLASKIAQVIRGKHKPYFTPHLDMGDFVIVINAEKINVTGNKENAKEYWHHTGYPGGQKSEKLRKVRREHPERIIINAVKGMLPHNRLGRKLNSHLKVYSGSEHPHSAQQPKTLELN
jgi:large subunit ribosomal protein L13